METMNQIQRCIHIFPRFEDSIRIDNYRKKHDYLYNCIEPHITLVFPFFSNIEDDMIAYDIVNLVNEFNPFEITCNGFTKLKGKENCIAVNIVKGFKEIYELHYLVHKGILKPYHSELTRNGSYIPHMTIGRFKSEKEMDIAFMELDNELWNLSTIVKSIFIEEIGKNEESILKNEIFLTDKKYIQQVLQPDLPFVTILACATIAPSLRFQLRHRTAQVKPMLDRFKYSSRKIHENCSYNGLTYSRWFIKTL